MGRDNFVAPKADKKAVPDVLGAIFADKGRPTMVAAASIRTDGGTQMRAGLDDATVFEYGQAMVAADGWGTFPPAIAYHDGAAYWLADGFHRVAAFLESFPDPKRTIPVDVRAGTRRDAVLHAAGANAEHGLRRTNADKRRSVETMLRDSEWAEWPDKDIAKACNVTREYVVRVRADIRPSLSSDRSQDTPRTVTRGGTTYTQNTANIGKPAAVLNTAPAGDWLHTRPAVVNLAPEDLVALGWSITMSLEESLTKYRAHHTDPARHMWGYCTELDALVAKVREMEARLAAAAEPAPISLDELEVVDSVTVPAAAPVAAPVDPDEEPDHPLDCYEENGAPAAGKMRDLWELKDWFARTKKDKLREYQRLTGKEVPAVVVTGLAHMIQRLEEAMDAYQAEVEAAHANQ